MTRLQGETALVIGGVSGLGRAICLRFAEKGANVVAADIDGPAAEETARMACGRALAVTGDMRHKSDCEATVRTTVERFGRLDIFVANAGIARGGTVLD